MNYPRVNLLKKSEQRYQGAVSRRFMWVCAVVAPLLVIAVISGIKLVQYNGIRSELVSSSQIWASLEPRLALHQEETKSLAANKKILALLDGWQESRVPMVDLMEEIQQSVPRNMQFARLALKGDSTKSTYETPEQMAVGLRMEIDGLIQGDLAEEDVKVFREKMMGEKSVSSMFKSIPLLDMRRSSRSEDITVREFKIAGTNTEGGK